MKTRRLLIAATGLAALGGCGGSLIDGKWCMSDRPATDFMTVSGGKMTSSEGEVATFTHSGMVYTATEVKNGDVTKLILSPDGKKLSVEEEPELYFHRCQ